MDFNETMSKIKEYTETVEFLNIIGNEYIKVFSVAVSKMENDFLCMDKNGSPEIVEKDIKNIMSSLSILTDVYLNSALSKNLIDFADRYSVLVFNWNNNTIKNDEIYRYSSIIERVFKNHLSSLELLDVTKKLIGIVDKKLSRYSVPSVEISRHYLESFDKK